ncbi:DNA-binding protein [Marinobacter sp.]|uniref:DNA-binding protein n=1 Tax=Marinobacter sp. TaxID=50741 RepID=UPI0034A20D7A
MATQKALTSEQVKAKLRAQGTTITRWAEEQGYRRGAVYRVLNGFDKAHYGQAHEIAVKLGMKCPEQSVAA